jgi:hypothetical protein
VQQSSEFFNEVPTDYFFQFLVDLPASFSPTNFPHTLLLPEIFHRPFLNFSPDPFPRKLSRSRVQQFLFVDPWLFIWLVHLIMRFIARFLSFSPVWLICQIEVEPIVAVFNNCFPQRLRHFIIAYFPTPSLSETPHLRRKKASALTGKE